MHEIFPHFTHQTDDAWSSDGGITDEENTLRVESKEDREGGWVGMEGREGQESLDCVSEIYRGEEDKEEPCVGTPDT